jgi:hypothetical protein
MGRISENISFGLEMFEHEGQRRLIEQQKNRFSHMFEALSATNEAIMRARTRAQLFELVCDAAVLGGTLTSATIALAEPGEEFLRIAASKGLDDERMRSPFCDLCGAAGGRRSDRNVVPDASTLHFQ